MTVLNSSYYQCRSFDSIYLFKVKAEEEFSLKILDLSQKCLFKKKMTSQEGISSEITQLLSKGNLNPVLEKLVEKHFLPKEYLFPKSNATTHTTCEKNLEQTIEQFKPHVLVDRKELENLTCPITFEVFKDPVIDEHGHTFEKSAIEEHLRNSNQCPINRQPIHSLTPNRLVKETIEEWQKKDPIPNFSLFKKENSKLAKTNLQMAQTYVGEKEYEEALEFYGKAFQYTKNWEDYASLPSLFEAMGEHQKSTLAYLYLAKYQLQAQKTQEAIQTLEVCQKGKSFYLQNNFVLIEFYYHIGEPKRGLALSIQTADTLSREHPEQAIPLYKRILRDHPTEFTLYSTLADLVNNPHEKRQILLKGILECLQQGDYTSAEKMTQKAESYFEQSFIDALVSLDLIQKQDKPRLKQRLLYLSQSFEKKGLTKEQLSAYKMLFQLEQKLEYCQKIVSAYQTLKNPHKALEWSHRHLSLLIKEKEWEQAETLAKHILQKSQSLQQNISLYENLEEIYTNWQGHKLQDLWPQLGKAYQDNQQLEAAEKTYRKAFEKFHRFEEGRALAEVLKRSRKTQESVHTYYEAAIDALLDKNTERLSICTKEIKQIDPQLKHLDSNQRMHLLIQENLLKLQSENERLSSKLTPLEEKVQLLEKENTSLKDRLTRMPQELNEKVKNAEKRSVNYCDAKAKSTEQELENMGHRVSALESDMKKTKDVEKISQQKINSLEKVVQPLKEKAIQEEKRRIAEEQERVRQGELEKKQREELSHIAFGKAKWEKYFGDIGTEPPLPKDIDQILKSPCPYWSGKKVEETHLLVLIPNSVNGNPFAIGTLGEMIKSPKTGHPTKYYNYDSTAVKELIDRSISSSYWALVTKDVLPNSRSKNYSEQQALIKESYAVPGALEIATGILMHHAETGERIYSDSPNTYTRCQEKLSNGYRVVVGSFGSSGLLVGGSDECRSDYRGLGGVRKFSTR